VSETSMQPNNKLTGRVGLTQRINRLTGTGDAAVIRYKTRLVGITYNINTVYK